MRQLRRSAARSHQATEGEIAQGRGRDTATVAEFRKQNKNANRHTERGLRLLSESIDRDGWIGALTVAADGETFDGSARLVTAQQDTTLEPIIVHTTGDKPVIVVRDDIPTADDPKAKRLGVMANHVTATDWEPDAAILAEIALDDAVIAALADEDAKLRELLRGEAKQEPKDAGELVDKAAELQAKWQVQRGDVWQVGKHRIMCGDSTNAEDMATLMRGERAQLCITDPPYRMDMGMGGILTQSAANIKRRVADLIDFNPSGLASVVNLNIPTWYVFCNKDLIPDYFVLFSTYRFNILVWCKTNPAPMTWETFLPDVEYILVFHSAERIWNNHVSPMDAYSKYYVSAKLEGRKGTGVDDAHPTIKPIEMVGRWVKISSAEGAIVLDPFLGSGTTLVACEQTGRIGRGMEIEPKYCAVSLERLAGLGLTPQRIGNAE